jgi:hypothetical protein
LGSHLLPTFSNLGPVLIDDIFGVADGDEFAPV